MRNAFPEVGEYLFVDVQEELQILVELSVGGAEMHGLRSGDVLGQPE